MKLRSAIRGQGCPKCHDSGFRGRAGVFEVLEVTDPVREFLHRAVDETELKTFVRQHGWRPLREEGLFLVEQGVTTLEEVLRVTHAETDPTTRAEARHGELVST